MTTPPWLALKVGTQARLGYSQAAEPEHAMLYPSADAARSGATNSPSVRDAPAGAAVSIVQIDPRTPNGKHVVAVKGDGVAGWVIAEDLLLPIPPVCTQLMVPDVLDQQEQILYPEQDDDEGTAFGATSHVTYEGFANDPGNAEYRVRVDDGPLTGFIGYVTAEELQSEQTHAFRLVP
jgi:hypothetical protein